MGKFATKDADGEITVSLEENEVIILATKNGLRKLISFCNQLMENPSINHIHLEDYELLTRNSLSTVLAIISNKE